MKRQVALAAMATSSIAVFGTILFFQADSVPALEPAAKPTGAPAQISESADPSLSPKRAVQDEIPAAQVRQMMQKGAEVYTQACLACHQFQGQGLPGMIPPLAKSDYLMEDKTRSIRTILGGLSGPITVNGKPYNSFMPQFTMLTDEEVASVLTYVRASWSNNGDAVSEAEVRAIRAELAAAAEAQTVSQP